MADGWMGVRVELLGGRGEDLWPPPGRVLAVGPRHTFADLATAIDDAFGRWDRSHLRDFTLADGRRVTDEETALELDEPDEPRSLLLDREAVTATVGSGEVFCYVFDFGDQWTHCCTVEGEIDPRETVGIVPEAPLPCWGWGSIPDQYGRRWADDDGEVPVPPRPTAPHPMRSLRWPQVQAATEVDRVELRGASYRGDLEDILASIEGHTFAGCLQQVGTALQVVLAHHPERAGALASVVAQQLRDRDWRGDEDLAEDLTALQHGTPPLVRVVEVDLSEVADSLETGPEDSGGYLDLRTGEVVPASLTDPFEVGEEYAVDVESDPDRWLYLEPLGGREGWHDMADFAADVGDRRLRERLEAAIGGRGAFRRFRDLIGSEGLVEQWRGFSDERCLGRARAHLAERGLRARPRVHG